MKTRSGTYYPPPPTEDLSDRISDNLLISILSSLCSDPNPQDFIMALMVCKRFQTVAMDPSVLRKASETLCYLSIRNNGFLQKIVDAGNLEACYMSGMIRFYCLGQWGVGVSLMEKAAEASHVRALYSLGVIRFNGIGRLGAKDPKTAMSLWERAANLGHIGAKVELAHCYVEKEYGAEIWSTERARNYIWEAYHFRLTNFDDHLPEKNMTMRFLREWFNRPRMQHLRRCSYRHCGLIETRTNEFHHWRFHFYYCSWNCQALSIMADA